jgi:polysaccharide biosynthesis/export protein
MTICVRPFAGMWIAAAALLTLGSHTVAASAQVAKPQSAKIQGPKAAVPNPVLVKAATPAPEAPKAEAAKADPNAGYILGPDDVIEVSVLGQPEFTTRARIRTDGSVVLPYVGSTAVAGETPITLAKRVSGVLKAGGYYSNPIVSVEIAGFASRYVTVLGAVAQPGLQPVDRPYRVSEIIARSGGIRADGAEFVVVRRDKGEEMKLPFEKLATGGNDDDPFVQPGDKIYVPEAETYYIYGQINAPGVYPIRNQLTLRKAIARGGGLGAAGSEKKISVYRDGKKTVLALDEAIKPGDVVVVGQRSF